MKFNLMKQKPCFSPLTVHLPKAKKAFYGVSPCKTNGLLLLFVKMHI